MLKSKVYFNIGEIIVRYVSVQGENGYMEHDFPKLSFPYFKRRIGMLE